MAWVRPLLIALLLVCGHVAAHEYTVAVADLVVRDDQATITLHLSPRDLRQTLRTPSALALTRATLDAVLEPAATALPHLVRLGVGDGALQEPDWVGYAPNVVGTPREERLPERLPFVLSWPVAGAPQGFRFAHGMYPDADGPVVCHLRVLLPERGEPLDVYLRTGELWSWPANTIAGNAAVAAIASASSSATAASPPVAGEPTPPFLRFMWLGVTHIVPEGLDHILFVLALYLLAPSLRVLLIQVTAFTVAHSISLGLALGGVVTVPAAVVEPLIAVSIAWVGIENLWFQGMHAWRWAVVFAFGLIHGLGFAGSLAEIEVPRQHLVQVLVGFNLGVEIGQLLVLGVAAAFTAWNWREPWFRRAYTIPGSVAIAAMGLWWTVERIWTRL